MVRVACVGFGGGGGGGGGGKRGGGGVDPREHNEMGSAGAV